MSTKSYSSFVVVLVLEGLGRSVVLKPPSAWRGAALARCSSVGWQQAAPANVCRCCHLTQRLDRSEMAHQG